MEKAFSSTYLLASESKIFRELCSPLISSTNINIVVYSQTYRGGGYFHFNTDPKMNWFMYRSDGVKHLFDYTICDALFDGEPNGVKCFFVEDLYSNVDYCSDQAVAKWGKEELSGFRDFNIESSFNVVEKVADCYKGFWFLSDRKKRGYNFSINNLDVLTSFITYFKENAKTLIQEGERNKVIWINKNPLYRNLVAGLNNRHNKLDEARELIKLKKYPLYVDRVKFYITEEELNCLRYLGQGFTYKQIASILGVGSRIVETHIYNIIKRLGISSQDELLRIYHASGL